MGRPAQRKKRAKTKLLKLVIDRTKWNRGNPNEARLVDCEGKRCCLGFLGAACGFTMEELGGAVSPQELPAKDDPFIPLTPADRELDFTPGSGRWPAKISRSDQQHDSDLSNRLMVLNDAVIGIHVEVTSEAVREQLISGVMRKAGVAVKYTGRRTHD
jgi:hypothetical protein